ncbi:ParB family protein [Billgrantia montanilacus]|uniref:ELM2 domain-containing protein n=1 Tax=Billgrantia montanilacus TaxID=2282305 RepID=A0A368TRZ5_9GAMM|nr:ParB family protein [Halomonas montanilacus]RCV86892.1 hypothetical protein DU505_18855 [Halomonas montanilacus]
MSKRRHPSQEELMKKLKTPGPALQSEPVETVGPPLAEQGIEVTLDKLRPYDRNPRTLRNPKYEEIKASIREVGLKHAPVVTQRPGDDKYMISDGGNTRLQVLRELYEETGDERFRKFHCIFRPWVSEAHILAGHLSENETRGDLSWIEKSLGTQRLKETLETEAGKALSQRELAKRAKELGFALDQSHISRMLYTVEHFWPTLPMSLESGMGQDQVRKLINYREACLLIWRRCEVDESDFGPAWHETMAYFDHEGQTALPWSIVEDRLLGMLEDATGAHLNPIDYALRTILDFRKRRWSLEEHDEDIWRPLDVEMERVRDPDAHPLTYFPPLPGEEDKGESGRRWMTVKTTQPQDPDSNPLPPSPSIGQNDGKMDDPNHQQDDEQPAVTSRGELEELRQQVERLQQENASLQIQPSSLHAVAATDVDEDTELPLPPAGPSEPLNDEERQRRLDALSLGGSQNSGETESFRRTREWLSRQQGEEPINFEDNALRAVPLRSAEPIYPVMDIWAIEPAFRDADRMRTEIGYFAVAIARWGGINLPREHQAVIPLHKGLGYRLEPLSNEQAQSTRAQRVWQLLAGLIGEVNPAYPTDVTLMGELLGTASDDDILPDEILVRLYRMVRLMRALRAQLGERSDDS